MRELIERLRRSPIALSIRQPWAHRILHEGKDIENRDWPTRFRGPVLIHAGKRPDDGYYKEDVAGMPMGGIVGACEIVDCVTESASPWFFGRHGFVLANPVPLAFVPCKGKLGFFVPEIDSAALRAMGGDDAE